MTSLNPPFACTRVSDTRRKQVEVSVASRIGHVPRRHLPETPQAAVRSGVAVQKAVETAEEAHDLLRARLASLDLRERAVQGDGNCQFRAISDQLYGTEKHHVLVRERVVGQLLDTAEKYKPFATSAAVPSSSYDEYVAEMAAQGTWGDHITLQAAADAFECQINLITSYGHGDAIIEIRPWHGRATRLLWLSFWAEIHYNSVADHS